MDRIKPFSFPSPKANIFFGVSAILKSLIVAALTLLSVDWADKITPINNCNLVFYLSSVTGAGLSFLNISDANSISLLSLSF